MNENRTYGVEIECVSKVSRDQLAQKVHAVVSQYGHSCFSGGYSHSTNTTNTNVWEMKTDSSIHTSSQWPYSAELVTPVLKGKQGLDMLKAVCAALDGTWNVNISTGLHVHHGVKFNENLAGLVNGWMEIESLIEPCLPQSRRENRYCQKWSSAGLTRKLVGAQDSASLRNWLASHNHYGRYVNLNLESLWLRGTVEFRWAAGSVDGEKIVSWVLVTQAIIERGLQNALLEKPESIQKLIDVLKGGQTITASASHRIPASGTKARLIYEGVRDGLTRQQILDRLTEQFGAGEHRVSSTVKSCFGTAARLTRNGYVVDNVVRHTTNADPDYDTAGSWLMERYNHFSR